MWSINDYARSSPITGARAREMVVEADPPRGTHERFRDQAERHASRRLRRSPANSSRIPTGESDSSRYALPARINARSAHAIAEGPSCAGLDGLTAVTCVRSSRAGTSRLASEKALIWNSWWAGRDVRLRLVRASGG